MEEEDAGVDEVAPPPPSPDSDYNPSKSKKLKSEYLYKILVIGEVGTGKTSFIKRYIHGVFSQHYRATIGVDFALKILNWGEDIVIRLQLWDIAGQERYGNMTRVYYKEAVGAFVVYDVSRKESFNAVTKWKRDLDSKVLNPVDGKSIPCVLLANKTDLIHKSGEEFKHLDEFCTDNEFIGWFPISAKENVKIKEAAEFLIKHILDQEKWSLHHSLPGMIKLEDLCDSSNPKNKKCCSSG